jgi:hypothetical protein
MSREKIYNFTFMKDLDVNELGMVDMTNYQVAVELLSDKNDSYLYDMGGGRNYNCNDCGKCFQ